MKSIFAGTSLGLVLAEHFERLNIADELNEFISQIVSGGR